MCKKILASGIKTLHLYTLNMDKSALGILMVISMFKFHFFFGCNLLQLFCPHQNLGLIEESKVSRPLPWRPAANVFRVKEDVRPIFW